MQQRETGLFKKIEEMEINDSFTRSKRQYNSLRILTNREQRKSKIKLFSVKNDPDNLDMCIVKRKENKNV